MKKLLVLDVVGLDTKLLAHAPCLKRLGEQGFVAPIDASEGGFPAVTTTVQSTFVTGAPPREHGIVGNGWYFRDLCEVWLWRQSNRLVGGESFVTAARRRDPSFTSAWIFWWYAMYGPFDVAVTPRPAYFADGRKSGDVWTDPPDLKRELNERLGAFPLFDFWGPRAGIRSSEWIAAAARQVIAARKPSACFVYLPHLDYDLQRLGPDDPRIPLEVAKIDRVAGQLIDAAQAEGYAVVALSEYGIGRVTGAVHPNRVLREAGYLRAQDNQVGELLDAGASRAFAVADHQVAHVYVPEPRDVPAVKALLERQDGVERVLDDAGKGELGIDHPRAGELVAVAAKDRWFTYYYWQDDARAPDFARTVDIHKKPGYDPLELLIDPRIPLPKAKVAWTLLKKALGFRYVLDVIPLDASLIRGSHGRLPDKDDAHPVFLCSDRSLARATMPATSVKDTLLTLCGR